MLTKNPITLGSLFDGIGAFPYAASFFGITPLWASEILPNSVSVTKRHFPDMEHLGDITETDGGRIPPVDVICFGSPCQSFSVAGPRTSFEGKSGLFFEAIRIIREMRCATNGNYPKIAIFENVPGVLSVDGGRSYQTIIEAFCEAEVPMPATGRWANAGMVRGGSVDFAWVCKDAQHYRVPQRRKRLLAVADFTGRRAAEILFVPQSLRGYFEARSGSRQGTPADSQSRAGSADSGGIDRNPLVVVNDQGGASLSLETKEVSPTLRSEAHGNLPIVCAAFMAGQAKNARSIAYNEKLSPTLKGAASGLNQTPSVLCMATGQSDGSAAANEDLSPTLTLNHEAPYICMEKDKTAYGICSQSSNSMRSGNPFSGIYVAETCKTLDRSCANPVCNQGGIAIVEPKTARTLTERLDSNPCADRARNVIAFAQNQRDEVRDLNGVAGCLAAYHGVKQQTYIAQPANCLTPWETQQARIHTPDGISPTLAGADGGGGRNPAGLVMTEVHPEVTGTLCGSGAGTSRTAGNCNETDLAIAYCLQGNMIGRADKNGPHGKGVNEELSYSITAADRHCVAAIDCRNHKEIGDMSGTLQAKDGAGYSLNYQNPIRSGYVIRRLTPTECERLMSFDDGYTACGADGKIMSDSARYQMLGNSIVVNVLAYIMQNVAEYLGREDNAK